MSIKHLGLFFTIITLYSCTTLRLQESAKYAVSYLDEFIIPSQTLINDIEIGGLSGIDFNGESYILICDQGSKPRIYEADIHIKNYKIDTVKITKQTFIKRPKNQKKLTLDMESIRFFNEGYLISTEGNINAQQSPIVFEASGNGNITTILKTPELYKAEGNVGPIHNRGFESLALEINNNGYWVTTEAPLQIDGKSPTLFNGKFPLRFTHINDDKVIKQFVYNLERIQKIPLLPFGLNGLTEILQLTQTEFLVIERSFVYGRGKQGYAVQLILASIENATDVKNISELNSESILLMKKTLLWSSNSSRKQLSQKFIDNIEGITYGPKLPNGNLSLILVADNNFNSFGTQLNQFILLELYKK